MRYRRASDNKMTFTFIQLSGIWTILFFDIAYTQQINNSICVVSIGMY